MMTHHAQTRMQQRALSQTAVEAIIQFGEVTRSHGADRYFLTRSSRRRLEQALGNGFTRAHARELNAYVVLADDGGLVTCAYRTRRLRRA